MVDLPIPLDVYAGGVNREYATIYADLLRAAEILWPGWTYHGPDDAGTVILQLQAYLADHLHHRADTTLRDLQLSRTVYREVAREHAERLGYFARRPTPAMVDAVLSVASPLAGDLLLPERTLFVATVGGQSVYFENLAPDTLPAGQTSFTVPLTQGRTAATVALGVATGRAWERFILASSDVLFNWEDGDIEIEVDGAPATHVRWSRDAGPNDMAYWVRVLRGGVGLQVRFGDGNYGRRLQQGAVVACRYRRGGGTAGNVGPGTIALVDTVSLDGVPVALTCSNPLRAVGGLPEETLEEIRQAAPAFYRSQDRAVTVEDYETFARGVSGVFRAKAVQVGVNGVSVYVVPDGAQEGDALSEALRGALQRKLDEKRMGTDVVTPRMATLVPIDIEIDVYAHRGRRAATVGTASRDALLAANSGYLAPASNDLAQQLNQSDMVAIVEDADGVNYLDVKKMTRRARLLWTTQTGDAALSTDGVTVTRFAQAQTWTIYFTSPTEYTVTGSESGPQAALGVLDQAYSDDQGEVVFTIEAGEEAMGEGDRGEIAVSQLIGNIRLGPKEFPVAGKVKVNVFGGIA